MKALLKELQFALNGIPRTKYYYGNDETDTYKLVAKLDAIVSQLPDKPTPFQIYSETMGNKCPLCNSEHIIAHPFNADNLDAWRDVECEECEETWREMFTMTNIDIL